MNCYEILEVSPNASPEVIKAAYKSLMQRYHPDKNPDNAEIAAHASRVVQAYEVLSDSNQRTAYDAGLKQQLAASMQIDRGRAQVVQSSFAKSAKEENSHWLLWLMIAATIVVCSYAMFLLKYNRVDRLQTIYPENQRQEASGATTEVLPRTIRVYISDLTVTLKNPDGLAGGNERVLEIPKLGVRVGEFDANTILRFLDVNKELIRERLEEQLGGANYDELIKPDGEQYLKNFVMDSIGETIGTKQLQEVPVKSVEVSQYGVVEILLPVSFSVN